MFCGGAVHHLWKGALQGNLVFVVLIKILCFLLLLRAVCSFGEVIPIKDLPSEKKCIHILSVIWKIICFRY